MTKFFGFLLCLFFPHAPPKRAEDVKVLQTVPYAIYKCPRCGECVVL